MLCGAVALLAASCTSGDGDRAAPTSVAPATTTVETLPPVGVYTYPGGVDDVIAQISVDVDAPLPLPVLTVYGNGRVVNAVDDEWRQGRTTDLAIQEVFDEADSIGLLDDDLVLRGQVDEGQPNIAVFLAVDGRQLNHELDLVRIERPVSIRRFLLRTATSNAFDLTEVYEPEAWINCDGDACTLGDEPADGFARPVLPNENFDSLMAAAGIDGP